MFNTIYLKERLITLLPQELSYLVLIKVNVVEEEIGCGTS